MTGSSSIWKDAGTTQTEPEKAQWNIVNLIQQDRISQTSWWYPVMQVTVGTNCSTGNSI